MKLALTLSVCIALASFSRAIILDNDGDPRLALINTSDLNLENIEDLSMTDAQKRKLMDNFKNLNVGTLNQKTLLTPDVKAPGDVTGVGLEPKSVHVFERTPNLRVVEDRDTVHQIHTIHQPLTVHRAKLDVQRVDIKGPKQINIVEPAALLPNLVEKRKAVLKIKAPDAVNAPDVQMSPKGLRAPLTIDIPEMESDLPSLEVEAMPDINMPQIEMGPLNKDLPSLEVAPIESHALPEIDVPVLQKAVPQIELPEDRPIPGIGLPNMDKQMADFDVVKVNPVLADAQMPEISDHMNDFNVNVVEQGKFAGFNVPDQKNQMESFNVPQRQSGNHDVVFDDIRLPNVVETPAPILKPLDIDVQPHKIKDINVFNVPHDIRMPQVDSPEFKAIPEIEVNAPEINHFMFKPLGPVVEPKVHIPSVGVVHTIVEPEHLTLDHELTLATHQQVIPDHVLYEPHVIVDHDASTQFPVMQISTPRNRDQDFIYNTVYCPEDGKKEVKEKVEIIKPKPKVKYVLVPKIMFGQKEEEPEPVQESLDNIDLDIVDLDPEQLVEEPIVPEVVSKPAEDQSFVYDLSFLKNRPNSVAFQPNIFKGNHIWVMDKDGNTAPYRISSKDLGDKFVGDAKG